MFAGAEFWRSYLAFIFPVSPTEMGMADVTEARLAEASRLVAGALLVGASILSGNHIMLAVAGGIGVNWTSESLMNLWQGQALSRLTPGSPFEKALGRAIRKAAKTLRSEYANANGGRRAKSAFDLLAKCADELGKSVDIPEITDQAAIKEVLGHGLDNLLLGHEGADWIKPRLLTAVGKVFQVELQTDNNAWRAFHGWLLQRMQLQIATQGAALAQLPSVVEQLADRDLARASLDTALRIEGKIDQHTDVLNQQTDMLTVILDHVVPRTPDTSSPKVVVLPSADAKDASFWTKEVFSYAKRMSDRLSLWRDRYVPLPSTEHPVLEPMIRQEASHMSDAQLTAYIAERCPLQQALREPGHLLILGGGGSGKSSVIRYYAWTRFATLVPRAAD